MWYNVDELCQFIKIIINKQIKPCGCARFTQPKTDTDEIERETLRGAPLFCNIELHTVARGDNFYIMAIGDQTRQYVQHSRNRLHQHT